MERRKTNQEAFIDLTFLDLTESDRFGSQTQLANKMKKKVKPPQAEKELRAFREMRRADAGKIHSKSGSKLSAIDFEFDSMEVPPRILLKVRKHIQTSNREFGIKIFEFRSNAPLPVQTNLVTKTAELLATQKNVKILLVHGSQQSRRTRSGKITPIYQVLRKSDFVNLYSMSLEGFFSSRNPAQQQKRLKELMQLFEISFDLILVNQTSDKMFAPESEFTRSPIQQLKLNFLDKSSIPSATK